MISSAVLLWKLIISFNSFFSFGASFEIKSSVFDNSFVGKSDTLPFGTLDISVVRTNRLEMGLQIFSKASKIGAVSLALFCGFCCP